uniref:PRA1 family protein n=1 Tax=Callorhinchus milii TaxID=7868 RepID=A0A4W3HM22_CALMI
LSCQEDVQKRSTSPKIISQGPAKEWMERRKLAIRPWGSFLDQKRFSRPQSVAELCRRAVSNVEHFQSNYVFVFLGLIVYCVSVPQTVGLLFGSEINVNHLNLIHREFLHTAIYTHSNLHTQQFTHTAIYTYSNLHIQQFTHTAIYTYSNPPGVNDQFNWEIFTRTQGRESLVFSNNTIGSSMFT